MRQSYLHEVISEALNVPPPIHPQLIINILWFKILGNERHKQIAEMLPDSDNHQPPLTVERGSSCEEK